MTLSEIQDRIGKRHAWGRSVKKVILSDSAYLRLSDDLAGMVKARCCRCGASAPLPDGTIEFTTIYGAVEIVRASSVVCELVEAEPS